MKSLHLLFFTLLSVTYSYAQQVEKITAKDGIHYITTNINYPITGTYFSEGATEPIVQLNPDGTGIFQLDDLSKTTIVWGMECFEDGTPKYQKGFNYAVYSLWHKNSQENSAINTIGSWTNSHFSIHFEKKKMFILGERSKDYIEQSVH
jgi:hypothetical protein